MINNTETQTIASGSSKVMYAFNEEGFLQFARAQVENILALITRKREAYSRPGDEFARNYRDIGSLLDLPARAIILVATLKHIWALCQWSRSPERVRDAPERMSDVIVFMLMLMFLEHRGEGRDGI